MNPEGSRAWRLAASIALVALGLGVSLYLTISHYSDSEVACAFGESCDRVAASAYATLFGVPVALLGALNYAALATLVLTDALGPADLLPNVRLGAVVLTAAGLVFSVYLTLVSATDIGTLCPWCLTSLAATTALFAVSFSTLYREPQAE
jgi:uncharacterized membrane protein